jgi:hypothetical protein
MKYILLFLIVASGTFSLAQDLIKVKGNREVTTEITVVEPFSILEIDGDYEVVILEGKQTQVELTTDSNLHDHISMNRIGDKLTIGLSARIRSKRSMTFRVTYGPELHTIIVTDDAQLSSLTTLEFSTLNLKVDRDARVYLTAKVSDLTLNALGESKSELNLTGNKATINIANDADVKALITYNIADITMKDKVSARLEGDIDRGEVTLGDRISLEANNLVFSTLELVVSNKAKAEVNVKDHLLITAEEDADITVYNDPKIELLKFEGESILRKK